MGEEIAETHFTEQDFDDFQRLLIDETALLKHWFEQDKFISEPEHCGFELEAWLVDKHCQPLGRNHEFIKRLKDNNVTPELANFNIEFNYTPQQLRGSGLEIIHQEMELRWQRSQQLAKTMGMQIVIIGILPTVKPNDLSTKNISGLHRYQLINEQVLKLRDGRPLKIDIQGKDILQLEHNNVMLESAATSFQIHYQCPLVQARRSYNASIIASAPMVALAANSPFLFGQNLWAETRIPLFEQSVEVGGYEQGSHGPMRRVTFGSGYAIESVFECFQENMAHYPVLLPTRLSGNPHLFDHLRMHNGTLWRWNRPLIGPSHDANSDQYHLRIEHRVIPAGPTILDNMANAAMFYGLLHSLASSDIAPEHEIPFSVAKDNFYHAAQKGLEAQVIWRDGEKRNVRQLILETLIPAASSGLQKLNVDQGCIDRYLSIIEQRVNNRQNGANWQQQFVNKYGNDMSKLTAIYLENQNSAAAVHEWDL